MRVLRILLMSFLLCGVAAADQPTQAAKPTSQPVDEALAKYDAASQRATDEMNAAVDEAAKQYKADLQTSLDAAMSAANLIEANTDKAELNRVKGGAQINDGAKPIGAGVIAARTKYDLAVKKATETRSQDIKAANRKCIQQMNAAITAALRAKDLTTANRLKAEEDRITSGNDGTGTPQKSGTYLCDIAPLSVSTFTDGNWGFGNKGRVGYGDLQISVMGTPSPHGLGTHPPSSGSSVVKYQLDGKYKRITGRVALDDGVERGNSPVIFRLVGDGHDIWRAEPIQSSKHPQDFDVNISGVKVLQLVVDCVGDHDYCHAVWVEPTVSQ